MSAAEAVMEARAAGIQLGLDGDDLVLEAAAPPSPAVLELLFRHKPAIVVWLRPGADGWSAEDWQGILTSAPGLLSSTVVCRARKRRPKRLPAV